MTDKPMDSPLKPRFEIREEPLTELGRTQRSPHSLQADTEMRVQTFEPPTIRAPGQRGYSSTRDRLGALAATDEGRVSRSRQDSRFALNPLLRDPLSIEDEERRVIEERVRARVQAVVDEARADAAVVGYRDGLARGQEEAFAKFQAESVGRTERIEQILGELEGARAQIFAANEKLLVDLVVRICKLVILRELKTDREYLLRLSQTIIERVGVRENIRIKLRPADLESVTMLKSGLEQSLGALKNLSIEASPEVRSGGVVVETEFNAIDASIDTQIEGLFEGLAGGTQPQ